MSLVEWFVVICAVFIIYFAIYAPLWMLSRHFGIHMARREKLAATIDSVSQKFANKTNPQFEDLDTSPIHMSYALQLRMYYHKKPDRRTFWRNRELLQQINMLVEREDSFEEVFDYSFFYTAINSTNTFDDDDLLAMFSVANSDSKAFNDMRNILVDHHLEQRNPDFFQTQRKRFELPFIVREEDHQIYQDVKSWIDAVVEGSKTQEIESDKPKSTVKESLQTLIHGYKFTTDYSGNNGFLTLPVEWQIDMVLNETENAEV